MDGYIRSFIPLSFTFYFVFSQSPLATCCDDFNHQVGSSSFSLFVIPHTPTHPISAHPYAALEFDLAWIILCCFSICSASSYYNSRKINKKSLLCSCRTGEAFLLVSNNTYYRFGGFWCGYILWFLHQLHLWVKDKAIISFWLLCALG